MRDQDIRWLQRLSNFNKALDQLEQAVKLSRERELSDLEKQGLIQAFEFTHELAWNVMKDYAHYQGNALVAGSRDATREAFSLQLISDGIGWMEMIKSRNRTSHAYDEKVVKEITDKIVQCYCPLFKQFSQAMQEKQHQQESSGE